VNNNPPSHDALTLTRGRESSQLHPLPPAETLQGTPQAWDSDQASSSGSPFDGALLAPPYGRTVASGQTSSLPEIALTLQLTAFCTSAAILASSSAVSSFSAKEVGHMLPSSRLAAALKPNVAYLSLNFDAGVK
jgi:hypothetical protein